MGLAFMDAAAQRHPCASQALRQLDSAYARLMQAPDDPTAQKNFFDAFPQSFFELEVLFGYRPDLLTPNLYESGYDYTTAFRTKLPTIPREQRVQRLISLFIGGHWEADTPNYLKEVLKDYMDAQPLTFFRLLSRRTPAEQLLFWQCFWQNPCYDPWLAGARNVYKKAAGKKYPREVRRMENAFRDFAGTIIGG